MTSQSPWGPDCICCPVVYLTPTRAMDHAGMLVRCPGSRLQNFTVFSSALCRDCRGGSREGGDSAWGRPEGQKLSEHFFPSTLSATHVAQLYPSSSIPHPSFPSTSFPGIRASFCFTLSSSQCLHLSPILCQPGRPYFSGSALCSLALL